MPRSRGPRGRAKAAAPPPSAPSTPTTSAPQSATGTRSQAEIDIDINPSQKITVSISSHQATCPRSPAGAPRPGNLPAPPATAPRSQPADGTLPRTATAPAVATSDAIERQPLDKFRLSNTSLPTPSSASPQQDALPSMTMSSDSVVTPTAMLNLLLRRESFFALANYDST